MSDRRTEHLWRPERGSDELPLPLETGRGAQRRAAPPPATKTAFKVNIVRLIVPARCLSGRTSFSCDCQSHFKTTLAL